MLNRKLIVLALVLLLAAGGWIAYRANIANATPAEVNVTVTASEFKYDPPTIKVSRGQTVHLTFRNASTLMVHELRMKPYVETKANVGLEDTTTFVASAVGTYTYKCLIPGHEAMVGTFVVE